MTSINAKKQETGKFSKLWLTLNENITVFNEVKKRKLSCRATAEDFKIGKIQTGTVVKKEAKLREENFQGKGFKHIKRKNHQKLKPINDILHLRFKKCEPSTIFLNGSLLKEKPMYII